MEIRYWPWVHMTSENSPGVCGDLFRDSKGVT